MLCDSSDYFTKALDGTFSESSTRELRLPGCDKETFQLFLFYLSQKSLPNISPNTDNDDDFDAGVVYARVWVFADYLVIPKLQDAALCQVMRILQKENSISLTEYAYDNSVEGSPLRRVVVAEAVNDLVDEFKYRGSDDERKRFERLAAIPGYFLDFAHRLKEDAEGQFCAPSSGNLIGCWMLTKEGKAGQYLNW